MTIPSTPASTDAGARGDEPLYRRVITKDRIWYEPAAPQPSPRMGRAAIALTLYDLRFPHRNWSMSSTDERALSLKQADAILALLSPDTTVVSSTLRVCTDCGQVPACDENCPNAPLPSKLHGEGK